MFDTESYILLELLDALTCPTNRNGTREEHSCDDVELNKHPEWLIEHYHASGGGDKWRETHWEQEEENYEAIANILVCFRNFTKKDTCKIVLNEKVRHHARIEHMCNDDTLFFNPEWLLDAYKKILVAGEIDLEKIEFVYLAQL